ALVPPAFGRIQSELLAEPDRGLIEIGDGVRDVVEPEHAATLVVRGLRFAPRSPRELIRSRRDRATPATWSPTTSRAGLTVSPRAADRSAEAWGAPPSDSERPPCRRCSRGACGRLRARSTGAARS